MNYFLVHIGSQLPQHLIHCLRQIIFVDSNCKITLCTDSNIKFDDSRITVINKNDLDIPNTGSYFCNERDPLWITSLQRIFLINSFLKKTNEPIIHFDNDVLIYTHNVVDLLIENEVYVTPQKHTEHIFGYCVIKNKDKFDIISNNIYNAVSKGEQFVLSQTTDFLNEMRLLNFYGKNHIVDLPVHPSIGSIDNTIFDPITYGQFLGGSNNGHPPGFLDKNHIVGVLLDNHSKVYMTDKHPVIEYKNTAYKINNLHVHGKQLSKFTTYDK